MNQGLQSQSIEVAVSLDYKSHSSLSRNYGEPEDYIVSVTADIIGTDWAKGESREATLGKLSLLLIRLGNASKDGISSYDVLDAHQHTLDAGNAIFKPSFREFNTSVERLFPDAFICDDIMLINHLEIKPFARGQKLGLAVLSRAIEDWSSGCSLVLIKPFPLQLGADAQDSSFWTSMALQAFPSDEKKAISQLRAYYGQLGFKRIGHSYFQAICPLMKQTRMEELELPDEIVISEAAFEAALN